MAIPQLEPKKSCAAFGASMHGGFQNDEEISDSPCTRPRLDDDVIVRVRAASMPADLWHVVTGLPYVMRLMGNGVRKPKWRVPGSDLAGVVESCGKNVTRFKIGDEVFGESVKFGWKNRGALASIVAFCKLPP